MFVLSRMDDETVYKSAKTYWEGVPATVSGMLDGFTQINSVDLAATNKFIRQFFEVGLLLIPPLACTQCKCWNCDN